MTDPVATAAGTSGPRGLFAPASRIVIAGASGYVGRLLTEQLAGAGHQVSALGRHPETLPAGERITPMTVDVADPESAANALVGADAAYYLVHAMAGGTGFEDRDRELAETFGQAAKTAGVGRIIYLGALGRGGSVSPPGEPAAGGRSPGGLRCPCRGAAGRGHPRGRQHLV